MKICTEVQKMPKAVSSKTLTLTRLTLVLFYCVREHCHKIKLIFEKPKLGQLESPDKLESLQLLWSLHTTDTFIVSSIIVSSISTYVKALFCSTLQNSVTTTTTVTVNSAKWRNLKSGSRDQDVHLPWVSVPLAKTGIHLKGWIEWNLF